MLESIFLSFVFYDNNILKILLIKWEFCVYFHDNKLLFMINRYWSYKNYLLVFNKFHIRRRFCRFPRNHADFLIRASTGEC